MDSRAAAARCMQDLARLIEGGDMRDFRYGVNIIKTAARSIPGARHRAVLLQKIAEDLHRFGAPDHPECDALVRGLSATIRRLQQHRLEGLAPSHERPLFDG